MTGLMVVLVVVVLATIVTGTAYRVDHPPRRHAPRSHVRLTPRRPYDWERER